VPGTHLSVRVLSGPHTLLTKIRFTALNSMFGELFLKLREEVERVGQGRVCKVTNGERAGNAGGTEVDLMAPVTLCEEFKCKYVTFFVTNDASAMATSASNILPNAFHVLMHASQDRSHLPPAVEASEHRQLIATERLHNGIVKYIKSTGAGFTRDVVNTVGNKVVKTLQGALWYVDTAHQQFEESSSFKEFQGYNDFKKNRKNKPRLNAVDLNHHSEALAGLLMLPSLSAPNCKKLVTDISGLSDCLRAYASYLR